MNPVMKAQVQGRERSQTDMAATTDPSTTVGMREQAKESHFRRMSNLMSSAIPARRRIVHRPNSRMKADSSRGMTRPALTPAQARR